MKNRGFSLIEVLVVIGLAAVIAAGGYLVSIGAFQRNVFATERDLAVSLLQRARSQAMANINESAHGVVIDTSNFMLYKDDTPPNGSYDSGEETLTTPRSSGVTTVPSSVDFLFEQLSGNVSSAGSLTMTGPRTNVDQAIITVESNGRIDWVWN